MVDYSKYFIYDETSPSCLRWAVAVKQNRIAPGTPVGYINPTHGYYTTRIEGVDLLVHRIVWEIHHGILLENEDVDHQDRCILHNHISNLRKIDHGGNMMNKTKYKNNSTGVTGVTWVESDLRYRVYWMNLEGTAGSKSFSLRRFGEKALELAVEFRRAKIAELNALGARYTVNHGIERNINGHDDHL